MLDGRVKTLHPKVHGGLLYIRGNAQHEAAVREHGIAPIDLVVVNLYPFEATVAKPNVSLHDAIENIDIGGPSMLRSAAKNHDSVTVIVDPADYAVVAEQIKASGNTTLELRRKLAAKVYARTAAYDAAIAAHLEQGILQPDQTAPPPRVTCDPRRWRSRCATARIRTRRRRCTASSTSSSSNSTARNFPTTTFSTSRRRRALIARVHRRRADAGDSQAHQSVRRGTGREPARGVGQGVCHGPAGAVRRHHRGEPSRSTRPAPRPSRRFSAR